MRATVTFLSFLIIVLCATANAQTWQWGRGNTGSGMDGWPVATDPAGNIFVAGINFGIYQVSFGSIKLPNSPSGSYQCIVAKYDAGGNILWTGGTENGNGNLINIATDQSGDVFMFGTFSSASISVGSHTLVNPVSPNAQYFIVKYDPSGNVSWVVNAGNAPTTYSTLGGIAIALGTGGITTDAAGYIYITTNFHMSSTTVGGHTLTNSDPSGTTNDILLAKYDPTGAVVWVKSVGGVGNDEAYGITVTPAGDIYIAGVFGSPALTFGSSVITNTSATQVAFIARFDVFGNAVWASGSGGLGGEYAIGLASDITNNVYLTGGLKDASISFSGTAINNPKPAGKPVLYLVKFDPNNSVLWYKTIGSVPDDGYGAWGYSIALTQCGVVWVSGCMHEPVNIDGNILSPPPASGDPIFMAAYTSSGTYVDCTALASGGDDQNGIACDGSGNVYMCSDYANYPFKIANDTFRNLDSTGELLYVGKYSTPNSASKNATYSKTDVCLSNFITLKAHDGYTNYMWNDGHKGATRTVTDTGIFWVLGFDSCTNSTVDTFKVTSNCDCGKGLFVPNAFTPNGDGKDDVFYPRCGPNVKTIKTFRVFNRWGEMLFERQNLYPNDDLNGWDGTYKGNLPLPDVYVWIVDAVCENGDPINKKGSVTIIR